MKIYRSGKPLAIIAAIAKNYAIGNNNTLLWHIPEDFKWFKKLTMGHTIIMGTNTYLSLPRRPLAGRKNIVISHTHKYDLQGAIGANSIEEAIELADADNENFIIGGASIYKQFMPLVDKLYITYIDQTYEADTFFPPIDANEWQMTQCYPQQEEHPLGLRYEFRVYERI
ncbi:MAG: dihydrofolate reductase [Bacteroidales bacterium]|nr:dihydrofolate reductase [Bacteroidales bacterium]